MTTKPEPVYMVDELTRRAIRDRDRRTNHHTPTDEDVVAMLEAMRTPPAR